MIDGRYQVVRRLAKGGMAHVFLAKDRTRKCHVAIKILHRASASARRRFELEAQVLSNIQCEYIVRAIAFGETADGQLYLALEYLEGETLSQRLAQGPLPWRDVARFGVQISTALHVLHAAGVIHRDLKPDNIMIAIGADRSVAKVIDLGLASVGAPFHEAQNARFASQMSPRLKSQLGHRIGTPEYLPPEAGHCDATPSLDVFSLGTTLYQLCTQLLPRMTRLRSIHEVVPGSDAPEDLSRLLRAALEPDAGDRLPSVDHIRRGLEAILAMFPATPAPRRLFGGCYDKLQVIGVGASAIVHRASDRRLSREVALKVLRSADPGEDDVIRFLRAAKILSALHHPNIPRILHCGEDGTEHFFVTELCSGVPATDLVRPDKHLRVDEVITIGRQLAGALAATHAAGLVYRDLHAGNVLIERGETPRAWLFDFDQAQVSPDFYARLTERWATPPEDRVEPAKEKPLHRMDYAAPEVRSGGAFTAASDVYALGLLLYRLLTGLRPFPADGGEAISPRRVCPACSRGLERLLLSMLNPSPGARPTLAAIEIALADEQAELEAELTAEREETPTPAATTSTAASQPAAMQPAEPLPSVGPTASPPTAAGPSSSSVATQTAAQAPTAAAPTTSSHSRRLFALLALTITIATAVMIPLAVVSRDETSVAPIERKELETLTSSIREATSSASTPALDVAPIAERPTAAEPEPAASQSGETQPRTSHQESVAPTNTARPRKPPPAQTPTPAGTWEARMHDAETRARRCLDAAGAKPRRVVVILAPGEPAEFSNVPSDSLHARCIRDALVGLHVHAETPRRHVFFDAT
ncbi:protein kinase domain-containing protein [Nannocystis exedens]|uniref:protein kinase domain-containing protein n=1 Tax=Nannocystis exedens TaxID=54 RepID=UPI00147484F0|nr:protein kinase [Nannocystis exedens]